MAGWLVSCSFGVDGAWNSRPTKCISSFVYLLVCVLSENLILAEFTHRIREKYFCESANERVGAWRSGWIQSMF